MSAHLDERIRLRRSDDLLAVIPYLLGFHPEHSIVAMAFDPGTATLAATIRYDLPDRADAPALADALTAMLVRNDISMAVIVGYGTGERVTPVIDAVRDALTGAGIAVGDLLRAENDRYWSYLCPDHTCCPPDGTPYDTQTSPTALYAILTGHVAQPDRAAFAATLDAITGPQREQMRAATQRARARADHLLPTADGLFWYAEGQRCIPAALDRIRDGEPLEPDEIAWLGVLLTAILVRDIAILLFGTYDDDTHIQLWTHLVRMLEPAYAAAPAALLAFVAMRTGDGTLARIAADRALATNPDYSLARLILTALDAGVPPAQIREFDWPSMTEEINDLVAKHPGIVRLTLPDAG
jgi:hypothetical protein